MTSVGVASAHQAADPSLDIVGKSAQPGADSLDIGVHRVDLGGESLHVTVSTGVGGKYGQVVSGMGIGHDVLLESSHAIVELVHNVHNLLAVVDGVGHGLMGLVSHCHDL